MSNPAGVSGFFNNFMKNKIVLLALAGLVLVAGAIYYSRSGSSASAPTPDVGKNSSSSVPVSAPAASNSGSLTRAKAESRIAASLKQSPTTIGVAGDLWGKHKSFEFSCPFRPSSPLFPSLDNLEKDGLIRQGSEQISPYSPPDDYFTFTDKARPYLVNVNYSGILHPAFLAAKVVSVKVTGLSRIENFIKADFSAVNQLTVFGEECNWPAAQNGTGIFTLYDDGWRLTNVELD